MHIPIITSTEKGLSLSRIAQGFGSLLQEEKPDAEGLARYVCACMDEGITTYDLAAVYAGGEAESLFGEALARVPGLRRSMTIITKYGIEGGGEGYQSYNTSREAIIRSAERSLTRMRTEHIDVLLMHRPDMLMDADEVAEALTSLRQAGKILHAGVSNFLPHQTDLLLSRLSFPLVINEVPYNLLNMQVQEDGTLDQCQRLRMVPLFYAPLGGGRLLAAPRDAQETRVRSALETVAQAHGGVPIETVAVAWVLKHPARGAALLGCGRTDWMRSAAAGASLPLTRDEWFYLWTASKGHKIP